jgi:two-component system sensor histidine kinase CpxA
MTSLFRTILLWGLATIGVSLLGFYATSRWIDSRRPRMDDMMNKTQALQLEGARKALEQGGTDELARYLHRLDEIFRAEHFLIDPTGKDLVDGTDRSLLQARASRAHGPPPQISMGMAVLIRIPEDGGSRLLIVVPSRPRGEDFLPYYLWILLVVLLLGYGLAIHLARPLVKLREAVDRFGRGDLSTRTGSKRHDEIGELARAFDTMAGRIETLLAAERRLLQDVSHELRSPLARLGFAIELARSGADPTRALDRIKRDVDRLSSLVGELLQLTSAEGDPHSRIGKRLRLGDLLREVVDDCVVEAEAKKCQFNLVESADAPAMVLGDPELLRRAVENVLRNAIRHAPEGSIIEVELRVEPVARLATVSVRDFGSGVPDEALSMIFEPFFRVDDDRSRSSGGIGLGLSIARRAIDLHRGKIEATNARPGLKVAIELPIADDRND